MCEFILWYVIKNREKIVVSNLGVPDNSNRAEDE